MKIAYVSSSLLPSRSANSIHVVRQCAALAEKGADVTLYAKRTIADESEFLSMLEANYGSTEGVKLRTFYSDIERAANLRIALLAVRDLLAKPSCKVISRNLYASFLLAMTGRPLLFETHQLEIGVRKHLQRYCMRRPNTTNVVISDKLVGYLEEHHGAPPRRALVLHDAADAGITPTLPGEKAEALRTILPHVELSPGFTCGYFGHLHSGRGIEVIAAMAEARPEVSFLVVGGNEKDIERCKTTWSWQAMSFTESASVPVCGSASFCGHSMPSATARFRPPSRR